MTEKGFSLINLGDLSKPATKLIEAVSNGIGILYEPARIRKKAKAESEAAIITAKGKIEIKKLSDRIASRNNYLEKRRQNNIEAIVGIALTQLPEEADQKLVDEDWVIQFFNFSQDISNEKMQTLWARLLAGEVARPNSYSLRTLNLIRILRQEDAEMIEKASNYVSNDSYIFLPQQVQEYMKTVGLGYFEILNLNTLGLCSERTWMKMEPGHTYDFNYFDKKFSTFVPKKIDKYVAAFKGPIGIALTDIGIEVLSLCNPKPDYVYWNLLEGYLIKEFATRRKNNATN